MNRQVTAKSGVLPAWRRGLVMLALLSLPLILMSRAVSLQLLEGDFLQGQGDQRHLRVEALPAHRGAIYDRNGEPLAISAPVDSVWAEPGVLLDQATPQQLSALADALGLDVGGLRSELAARQTREFFYLRRHVDPSLAETAMALEIPGVHLQREYRRFYPAGEVTGHVLGFTDIDDRGQEGLELAYDDWLSGEPGAKRVLRDRLGRTIEDVERLREPAPGRNLTLTIDKRLQYIAYRELKRAVEQNAARGGSLVLMDARNGDVLAMVNQPAFNPNRRSDITGGRYRNRVVTDIYEPGSVTKPFTVAAALASGLFTADSQLNTSPGVMRVGSHQVRDVRDFGQLDIEGLLRKSSNVGAAQMALEMEPGRVWQVLNEVGLGQPTGIAFPGEAGGFLAPVPSRRPVERATLAFGYGLSVTNLQLARAYSVFATDGQLLTPRLLVGAQTPAPTPVLEPALAREIRHMLSSVTRSGGTATQAAISGYAVAGKTGTSRKAVAGGYAERRYISTFAGMAPVEDPRFIAVVTIDEPSGDQYYAGPVAGPVFQAVVGDALRLYNVTPDRPLEDGGVTVAGGGAP